MSDDSTTATWKNTFNGEGLKFGSFDEAAAKARSCDYPFLARAGKLHLLLPDRVVSSDIDTARLDVGVRVTPVEGAGAYVFEALKPETWAVMRVNYEYDDERYNRRGESLLRVFSSRAEAEAEAHRLTVEELVRDDSDPFELCDYDGADYDSDVACETLVSMPWPVWRDWLMERGIDPPEAGDGPPTFDQLHAWWLAGKPSRTWAMSGYITRPGKWTAEQTRAAAEHMNFDLYTVEAAN